jgi:hypothetical protein
LDLFARRAFQMPSGELTGWLSRAKLRLRVSARNKKLGD